MQLVVRSPLDPETQAGAVRTALRGIDPNIALFGLETIEQRLSQSLAPRRLNLYVLACFATAALALACVGLGGVMAYLVSQRTRELGIRLALGAPARRVFGLVIGQGMRLAVAGAALGVLAGLLLSRAMQGMLFAVSASDPLTFVAVPAVLLLVALASCWYPARRAARVDPNRILRAD
jgi:ABC-type antimicrobial peptide transport system permease subunit